MEMSLRRYLRSACIVSALTLAGLARADDAALAEGQPRFKEGLELAAASNFEGARLKFLQALAVLKTPAVFFNLALTEQKTGHDVEAVEHYRAFLDKSDSDARITDAMRERAHGNIAELEKRLLRIEVDAPYEAKISIDGKPVDRPMKQPIVVAPGKHKVEAALGGKIDGVTVEGVSGQVVKAKLDLTAGSANAVGDPSRQGERTTGGWAVPLTLGALGVGGLVLGGAFASASQSSQDESEAMRRASPGLCSAPSREACAAYDAKRDDARSQATLGYAGYVAGGVLIAGAVAAFLLWPKSERATASARIIMASQLAAGHLQLHF
jgi:hypothetical protein